MKTKHTSFIRERLSWHLSTINALFLMLNGLILSSSVTLSRIASLSGSSVQNESLQRRFSRFLKRVHIDSVLWAKLILHILPVHCKAPVELLIDRINWNRGSLALNFLVVAIRFKRCAVPLFVRVINEQNRGNSSFDSVRSILLLAVQVFGKKRTKVVIGDREFGSFNRIELYESLGLEYVVRLKEEWHYTKSEDGEGLLCDLFKDLKLGKTRTIHGLKLGRKGEVTCSVSAKRKRDNELILVAHSRSVKGALKVYQGRWRIERLFLEAKSQGFEIEKTGIKDEKRLENLWKVVGLATALVMEKGMKTIEEKGMKIKSHKYPAKSVFKTGLETLRRSLFLYPPTLNFFVR